MRLLVVCLALLSLSGCVTARDPAVTTAGAKPVGNWRIERQTDRVTGSSVASAWLRTEKSSTSNSKSRFADPAQLEIMCFKGDPIVRFQFVFKVGSNRNSVLSYRFDDKPGHEGEARFLQGLKTVVIEDKNEVDRFLRELAESKSLYVLIRSLSAGRSSAEFLLTGAETAIEEALSPCRGSGDTKQRRA